MGWKFYNATGQLLTAPASTATADLATTVTVTDNEAINENNVLTFVANAAATGGNVGLESDGDLHYNPSTGLLTATGLTLTGNLTVSGTTTTISSTTITVDDKNLELGSVDTPTDVTADGGGITLKGASDKTLIWDNANDNWTSNQDWNIASGKVFKVNNVSTVTATGLGSAVVGSSLTSTGALNSGSITSGFGTIDTGSSTLGSGAITSTGVITGTGFTIGSAAIDETELEILDGATVTTTELNLIDGGTARGTNAVATGDGILINDAGTMHMTNVDTVSTYFASHSVGGGNIVTTGALNAGSITSGFTSIDIGSGALGSGNITSSGSGATNITSTSTSAEGILLHVNGGASETIKIHSDQGTGNDSIELLSDVGGISLDVADGKLIKLGGATVFDDEIAVAYNSGNPLVDCTKGNKFTVDMSGAVTTLFFTNPGSTVSGNYMVRLIHNGGARTIGNYYHTGGTTKVHFAAGTKPTLTATTSAEDILALYWDGAAFHATIMLDSKAYS